MYQRSDAWYSDEPSPPLLVVPVYEWAGSQQLWEVPNPWHQESNFAEWTGHLREAAGKDTALFLIECADGFRCAVLHCMGEGSIVGSWAYAGKVDGEVLACGCECAPLLPPRAD